jgi:hypothetical protein
MSLIVSFKFINETSVYQIKEIIYCRTFEGVIPALSVNPLKTECVCFIQGLSAYRAVNTLHFGYKNPLKTKRVCFI